MRGICLKILLYNLEEYFSGSLLTYDTLNLCNSKKYFFLFYNILQLVIKETWITPLTVKALLPTILCSSAQVPSYLAQTVPLDGLKHLHWFLSVCNTLLSGKSTTPLLSVEEKKLLVGSPPPLLSLSRAGLCAVYLSCWLSHTFARQH